VVATRAQRLRIPPNSRVPDAGPGASTPSDYDRYFDLDRRPTNLLEWTAGCLALEQGLLPDLRATDLSEQEQNQILAGLLVVYRTTLERWTRAARGS